MNTFTIFEDYPSYQPQILSYDDELNALEQLIEPKNISVSKDGSIQIMQYVPLPKLERRQNAYFHP